MKKFPPEEQGSREDYWFDTNEMVENINKAIEVAKKTKNRNGRYFLL